MNKGWSAAMALMGQLETMAGQEEAKAAAEASRRNVEAATANHLNAQSAAIEAVLPPQ